MHPILNIAIRIVRKVGAFILQVYDSQSFAHHDQQNTISIVNTVIVKSEKIMVDMIKKFYPDHKILSTYNIREKFENNKIYWLINPLSGKINFSKKIPYFCTSISIIINKKVEASVIYDPLQNELFTSVKGQGSKLNGFRTRCIQPYSIKNTIISINNNFIYTICTNNIYSEFLNQMNFDGIQIKCLGSLTLNLAYVSVGRTSGLICIQSPFLKILSGELQIRESGGLINNFNSNMNIIQNNKETNMLDIVVGSSKLIKYVSEQISKIKK
ncbi:Inositol-1-monophosphatase [Buchnera aphidicola (Thelaxes suberi)]|uniref:inositol monophosphatase family protein n=1 Tax=Buchnera aphidicola TaxID=9 RepID=UPI00346496F8